MLGKILRDDKGTLLIGAFGLPTRDQEYRPDDAIRAGRAIAAHARERGLTCQVGIASGKTFCGPIGSPQRREYTIIGEVPNRAARLTGLGVEGVVCDPQTRRLARDWAFEPAGTVKLKGLAAPVPVFTPSEEGHGSTYGGTVAHDRLVGRETELARLERAVAELIEGRKLRVFGSPPPGPERDKLAEAASAARWLMEPALYVVDSPVAYPASVFWHVNLAERAGADATPAGLAAVGIISGGMKKPAVAERYFLRAREAADGGEERWERYHAYVTEAFYYALNTRWQKAA
ncbi:MAG: adenylate/guanylate cyclase domain-containing protein [Proteobacteria bacterium]|nr:adenylate/guanylate cyclase domain-containing protein [Pseudomonadota bacterium]